MEVYEKLLKARQTIKKADLKKTGRNKFSNYDYYTPEQVNKLVNDACDKLKLFNKYDLLRTENGLMATLTVIDVESTKMVQFEIATEIPEIKATNVTQQIGGAVTYSERYLLMLAYDIKDNNLDFDSQDNTKTEAKPTNTAKPTSKYPENDKEWLSEDRFNSALKRINEGEKLLMKLKDQFKMKKIYWTALQEAEKNYKEPVQAEEQNEPNDLPFE